jgi:hypothetical protein
MKNIHDKISQSRKTGEPENRFDRILDRSLKSSTVTASGWIGCGDL